MTDAPALTLHRTSAAAFAAALAARNAGLSPTMGRIMDALRRTPHGLTVDDLAEVVWGDDPEGGPLAVTSCLSATIHVLRGRLRPLGLTIPDARLTRRYRLERVAG